MFAQQMICPPLDSGVVTLHAAPFPVLVHHDGCLTAWLHHLDDALEGGSHICEVGNATPNQQSPRSAIRVGCRTLQQGLGIGICLLQHIGSMNASGPNSVDVSKFSLVAAQQRLSNTHLRPLLQRTQGLAPQARFCFKNSPQQQNQILGAPAAASGVPWEKYRPALHGQIWPCPKIKHFDMFVRVSLPFNALLAFGNQGYDWVSCRLQGTTE